MSAQTYDFTIGINGSFRIDAMGSRFRYLSSSTGAELKIRTPTGATYKCKPGQGFSLAGGQQFREVVIVNESGAAITGYAYVSDDTFEDGRIAGDVSVIDGSAAKTLMGKQFYGGGIATIDAANNAVVGLLANGKTIAVRAIMISSATAGAVRFGTGTGPGTTTAASFGVANKLIGGAVSTSQRFAGICAANVPAAGEIAGAIGTGTWFIQSNQAFVAELPEPLILSGTQVFYIHSNGINRDISAAYAFEEL